MKPIRTLISLLALSSTLSLSLVQLWGAEGVISKTEVPGSSFCHLKFPAIHEETLYSSHPMLKDARDGDIIDFYGPCDHDPLGPWEIARQRADVKRDRREDADSD